MSLVAGKLHAQQGSALLVAMVMIFLISIMGVTVMRSSNLEHRMAANSIQSATVFQAAESVVEQTLNDKKSLTAAFQAADGSCSGVTIERDISLKGNDIPGLETNAKIRFTRVGLAEGYSSDTFVALYFETLGTSSIPSANAEAAIIRGAHQIVPKGTQCQ